MRYKQLALLTSILLLASSNGFSQEDFNETRGFGLHAGFFYWPVTKDLLIEPGIQFKFEKNLLRISNEFLLYKGQVMESLLAFNYRRYPFRNSRRSKFFLSGELQYLHTEGYYSHTRRVSGVFTLIGTGMQYAFTDRTNLGIEAAWGTGYVKNSERFENNTLLYKTDFALTLSYSLEH
ncbi:hypothetical protein ES705_49738 [subsurface metagenome]